MTRGEFDDVDLVAMPVFLLGSLFQLDLLSVDSLPLIGDPAAAFSTVAGVEISIAMLLSLVALGVVAYTNNWSIDGISGGVQGYIVIATVGLIIAPPFMPALEEAVSGGVGAMFALAIQTSGYAVLSYVG